MKTNNIKITIQDQSDEGERLDKFLADNIPKDVSRSYIQKLIKEGGVLVNEQKKKSSYVVKFDDVLDIDIPEPIPYEVTLWNINLDIIYEDDHLLVINKPAGMVVHPGCGHMDNKTLVNALLAHCKDLSGINGIMRPGIVHRLDKDTSGLMMAAKDDITHRGLAIQLQDRTLTRKYLAIVCGQFPVEEKQVVTFIGRSKHDRRVMTVVKHDGKEAISNFKVKQRFHDYTLMDVSLKTGRTHQIRVHLKHLGYPILGDATYSPSAKYKKIGNCTLPIKRQALHAYEISFIHPITQKTMSFSSPLPSDIESVIKIMHQHQGRS